MTLQEYQEQAMKTCLKESNNFSYMILNLMGEVGEFSGKVAKLIRKGKASVGYFMPNDFEMASIDYPGAVDADNELMKEAGDILWQLSGLCTVMGWSLEDVAEQNLQKLADRQQRHVIDGNGDNR